MYRIAEALVLYLVIFFPGIAAVPSPEWLVNGMEQPIPFSMYHILGRTVSYTLPSLMLVLFFVSRELKLTREERGNIRPALLGSQAPAARLYSKYLTALKMLIPRTADIIPFIITLSGLVILGFLISLSFTFFWDAPPSPLVEGPAHIAGWLAMIASCLGTGYLEETYFRYYLLSRLESISPFPAVRAALSALLFAVCHLYYGPGAILNAACAGVFLSFMFIRFKSLPGIALAHACYNMFVYASGITGA